MDVPLTGALTPLRPTDIPLLQRYYVENPESGQVSKVRNDIDDLKQIMVKNIGKFFSGAPPEPS